MTVVLTQVTIVKHTDAGTMLVDNHQTRFYCRHQVLALILVVSRRLLRENLGSRLWRHNVFIVKERWLLYRFLTERALFHTLIQTLPLIRHTAGTTSTTLLKRIIIWVIVNLGRSKTILESVAVIIKQGNVWLSLSIEINRRHFAVLANTITNSCRQNLPDGLFILKLNFGLGRMYVHIYLAWLHLNI